MAERKIFAGAALRRLRRNHGLTQVSMAETLDISSSYLNLIEHNQRPISAAILLRIAERFDIDPRDFAGDTRGEQTSALKRLFGHSDFADLDIVAGEIADLAEQAPGIAAAILRLAEQGAGQDRAVADGEPLAVRLVRQEIERWKNHFADLDAQAEALADELRLGSADLYGAISERLRARHQLAIRILPVDVMPDRLRRLDLHARQLQLSEMLEPPSRTFQAATQLAQLEARAEVDALVAGANLPDRAAERLLRRHLFSYFAAALIMPYARFLRACEATGYDLLLLQRRFGAGFEQVAHRLTTLQRVGARGLPFFMLRIDRAGQSSKRYAGASGSPLVASAQRCPLWNIHGAFARPAELLHDLVELEDGTQWLTFSRTVEGPTYGTQHPARFAVAVGVEARFASSLSVRGERGVTGTRVVPVGLGCIACMRPDCSQRSAPPAGRTLLFNERERTINAYHFAGD